MAAGGITLSQQACGRLQIADCRLQIATPPSLPPLPVHAVFSRGEAEKAAEGAVEVGNVGEAGLVADFGDVHPRPGQQQVAGRLQPLPGHEGHEGLAGLMTPERAEARPRHARVPRRVFERQMPAAVAGHVDLHLPDFLHCGLRLPEAAAHADVPLAADKGEYAQHRGRSFSLALVFHLQKQPRERRLGRPVEFQRILHPDDAGHHGFEPRTHRNKH